MKINYNYQNIFNEDVNYFIRKGFPSDVFSRLSRGIEPIMSAESLRLYNALYAGHHITKLKKIIPNCSKYVSPTRNHAIIDWACGQGIASSMMLDELYRKNKLNNIKQIYLIEPSRVAIERAREILIKQIENFGLKVPEIVLINNYFHEVKLNDFNIDRLSKCLHLFSNAIDTDINSTFHIMKIIKDLSNQCLIASTSPNYHQTTAAYLKIRTSLSSLNSNVVLNEQGFEPGWIYRVKDNYWGFMNISYNQLMLEVVK